MTTLKTSIPISVRRCILATALFASLSLASSAPPEASQAEEHKKLALLVGIDDYENVSDLDGCVNDVENMKSLLRDKFGFEERDILTLVNEQATRKAILDTFQRHLIAQAKQGDIVVFHYSGHGSQMKDARIGGDEADQFDETIVPQDSRKPGVFDIPDDSINGLLRLLSEKTDNVTFIFDSCHSGTVARAAGKVRTVEKDERPPPPPDSFAIGDARHRRRRSTDGDPRMPNTSSSPDAAPISSLTSIPPREERMVHLLTFLRRRSGQRRGSLPTRTSWTRSWEM